MMKNMNTVKVVTTIVSYNPYKSGFFPECLNRVKNLSLQDEFLTIDHKVIIVDNSPDNAVSERIQADFPWVKVVKPEENTGYAGGNNIGLRNSLENGAEYAGLVTQDVYVEEDWLKNSVKALMADKSVGVDQLLLLLENKPGYINSTGNETHFLGYGYAGGYMKKVEQAPRLQQEITYFSGAAVVFSTKALQETGLFDEEMWMYNEDQDLGWRLWLKGYKNVMDPSCRASHHYEYALRVSRIYYMDRNRIMVVLQNYHWATLLLLSPVMILNELGSLLLAFKGGWFKEKRAVWRYFLRPSSWKLILQKRRIRQKGRRRKEAELVKRFTGKILFQDVMNPFIQYIANPLLNVYWKIVRIFIIW